MDVRLPDGTVIKNVPDGLSKVQLVEKLKANGYDVAKLESKEASTTLPVNAGLANFASSVAGLPVDTGENVINLIRATQGTVAGALGQTDWMPPLLKGSVGGSQWIREKLRNTQQPGLSPDNPSPHSKLGTAQYDFTSRGGFIPGGALPAAGSMAAEQIGGPEWAGVGVLAPQAAVTAYNAARAPSLARQESQNAVRDTTLTEGREAGYVVPPSAAGGGFVTRRLESIGGKAAIGQEAAVRNQKVTNAIAREELGLPKDTPISLQTIEAQRNKLAAPYREVAAISDDAASALEKLKQARFEANTYFKHYDVSADPASLAKARTLADEAKALERVLEDAATNAGKAGLVQELREARASIAKTFDVERALNLATGDVSAPTLGRMFDKGKPLSGGLATAGRFQQAFPAYMREGEKIPTPGVSKVEALSALGLGLGGYGIGGVPGIAMAALPLASGPVRHGLLSGPVQNGLLPNYGPALTPAPAPQLLYQLGILENQKR